MVFSVEDERWMKVAIEESRRGDWPYGAVVVSERGELLAQAHNRTVRDSDPSCHAEVAAIRAAMQTLKRQGETSPSLQGCTLYTSSESCPMCAGAVVWSGLSRVVFGASIDQLMGLGQTQIAICAAQVQLAARTWSMCKWEGGLLAEHALQVVKECSPERPNL